MQGELFDHFDQILQTLVLFIDSSKPEVTGHVFKTLSYLFKHLSEKLKGNVDTLREHYGPLLGHRTKFVRQFAAESFAFILRKLRLPKRMKQGKRLLRTAVLMSDKLTEKYEDYPRNHGDTAIRQASKTNGYSDQITIGRPADLRDGIAATIYQCLKGVRHELHSEAVPVFDQLLAACRPYKTGKDVTEDTKTGYIRTDISVFLKIEILGRCLEYMTETTNPLASGKIYSKVISECYVAIKHASNRKDGDDIVGARWSNFLACLLVILSHWVLKQSGKVVCESLHVEICQLVAELFGKCWNSQSHTSAFRVACIHFLKLSWYYLLPIMGTVDNGNSDNPQSCEEEEDYDGEQDLAIFNENSKKVNKKLKQQFTKQIASSMQNIFSYDRLKGGKCHNSALVDLLFSHFLVLRRTPWMQLPEALSEDVVHRIMSESVDAGFENSVLPVILRCLDQHGSALHDSCPKDSLTDGISHAHFRILRKPYRHIALQCGRQFLNAVASPSAPIPGEVRKVIVEHYRKYIEELVTKEPEVAWSAILCARDSFFGVCITDDVFMEEEEGAKRQFGTQEIDAAGNPLSKSGMPPELIRSNVIDNHRRLVFHEQNKTAGIPSGKKQENVSIQKSLQDYVSLKLKKVKDCARDQNSTETVKEVSKLWCSMQCFSAINVSPNDARTSLQHIIEEVTSILDKMVSENTFELSVEFYLFQRLRADCLMEICTVLNRSKESFDLDTCGLSQSVFENNLKHTNICIALAKKAQIKNFSTCRVAKTEMTSISKTCLVGLVLSSLNALKLFAKVLNQFSAEVFHPWLQDPKALNLKIPYLLEALAFPDRSCRLIAVQFLNEWQPLEYLPSPYWDTRGQNEHSEEFPIEEVNDPYKGNCNLIQTLVEIERLPNSIITERQKVLRLEQISTNLSSGRVPEFYVKTCLFHLLGMLFIKFSPLWKPAISSLTILLNNYTELSWPRLSEQLLHCAVDRDVSKRSDGSSEEEIVIESFGFANFPGRSSAVKKSEDLQISSYMTAESASPGQNEILFRFLSGVICGINGPHALLERMNTFSSSSQSEEYTEGRYLMQAAVEENRLGVGIAGQVDPESYHSNILHTLCSQPEVVKKRSKVVVPIFLIFMRDDYYGCSSRKDPDAVELDFENAIDDYRKRLKGQINGNLLVTTEHIVDQAWKTGYVNPLAVCTNDIFEGLQVPSKGTCISLKKGQSTNRLRDFLRLFAHWKGWNDIFGHEILKPLFERLLSKVDGGICQWALKCLLNFKNHQLGDYQQSLGKLCDDKEYYEELTRFSLESGIRDEDRQNVVPLTLRIMFARLLQRKGHGKKGSPAARRKLILNCCAGLREEEIGFLIHLMIRPLLVNFPEESFRQRNELENIVESSTFKTLVGGKLLHGRISLIEACLFHPDCQNKLLPDAPTMVQWFQRAISNVPAATLQGCLNVMQAVISHLSLKIECYIPVLMAILVACYKNVSISEKSNAEALEDDDESESVVDEDEHEAGKTDNQKSKLRTLSLLRIRDLIVVFPTYDWSVYFELLSTPLEISVNMLPSTVRSASKPPAVLQLLNVMSGHTNLMQCLLRVPRAITNLVRSITSGLAVFPGCKGTSPLFPDDPDCTIDSNSGVIGVGPPSLIVASLFETIQNVLLNARILLEEHGLGRIGNVFEENVPLLLRHVAIRLASRSELSKKFLKQCVQDPTFIFPQGITLPDMRDWNKAQTQLNAFANRELELLLTVSQLIENGQVRGECMGNMSSELLSMLVSFLTPSLGEIRKAGRRASTSLLGAANSVNGAVATGRDHPKLDVLKIISKLCSSVSAHELSNHLPVMSSLLGPGPFTFVGKARQMFVSALIPLLGLSDPKQDKESTVATALRDMHSWKTGQLEEPDYERIIAAFGNMKTLFSSNDCFSSDVLHAMPTIIQHCLHSLNDSELPVRTMSKDILVNCIRQCTAVIGNRYASGGSVALHLKPSYQIIREINQNSEATDRTFLFGCLGLSILVEIMMPGLRRNLGCSEDKNVRNLCVMIWREIVLCANDFMENKEMFDVDVGFLVGYGVLSASKSSCKHKNSSRFPYGSACETMCYDGISQKFQKLSTIPLLNIDAPILPKTPGLEEYFHQRKTYLVPFVSVSDLLYLDTSVLLEKQKNSDLDGFQSIGHVDFNERCKALKQLQPVVSQGLLSDASLRYFVLPLTINALYDGIGKSSIRKSPKQNVENNLRQETEKLAYHIARKLPWDDYVSTLKILVKMANDSSGQLETSFVKFICSFIGGFHFPTGKDDTSQESPEEEGRKMESTAASDEKDMSVIRGSSSLYPGTVSKHEMDVLDLVRTEAPSDEDDPDPAEVVDVLQWEILPRLQQLLQPGTAENEDNKMHISSGGAPTQENHLLERAQIKRQRRNQVVSDKDIRTPVALAIVKILKLLPTSVLEIELPRILTQVATVLASREQAYRDKAKTTMSEIAKELGAPYLNYLVSTLHSQLSEGYQKHVLGHVIHLVIFALYKSNQLVPQRPKRDPFAEALVENGASDQTSNKEQDKSTEFEPELNPRTKALVSSLGMLVDIVMEDIVGSVAKARQKDSGYTPKVPMKESRTCRSYDTFEMLARSIPFLPHSAVHILATPMLDALASTQDSFVAHALKDLMNRFIQGLSSNPSATGPALTAYVYCILRDNMMSSGVVTEESLHEIEEQKYADNLKEKTAAKAQEEFRTNQIGDDEWGEAALENLQAKKKQAHIKAAKAREQRVKAFGRLIYSWNVRNPYQNLGKDQENAFQLRSSDTHRVLPEPKLTGKYSVKSGKFAQSADKMSANHMIEFGFSLFAKILKAKKVNPMDSQQQSMLNPCVILFVQALQRIRHTKAIIMAMRCLGMLLIARVPAAKENPQAVSRAILSHFSSAVGGGKSTSSARNELASATLRCVTAMLQNLPEAKLSNEQIRALLSLIQQDLDIVQRQNSTFALLRAIINRRIQIAEVYDVMEQVSKKMILTGRPNARQQAAQLFLRFLLNYPLSNDKLVGNKDKQGYIGFFIKNLEFPREDGRLAVVDMLYAILKKFPTKITNEIAQLLFINFIGRLATDSSPKCRAAIGVAIQMLFTQVDVPIAQTMVDMICKWSSTDQPAAHKPPAFQAAGLLLDACYTAGNDKDNAGAATKNKKYMDVLKRKMQVLIQNVQGEIDSSLKALKDTENILWEQLDARGEDTKDLEDAEDTEDANETDSDLVYQGNVDEEVMNKQVKESRTHFQELLDDNFNDEGDEDLEEDEAQNDTENYVPEGRDGGGGEHLETESQQTNHHHSTSRRSRDRLAHEVSEKLRWESVYHAVVFLGKLLRKEPSLIEGDPIFKKAWKLLQFPHVWVRKATLRFYATYFDSIGETVDSIVKNGMPNVESKLQECVNCKESKSLKRITYEDLDSLASATKQELQKMCKSKNVGWLGERNMLFDVCKYLCTQFSVNSTEEFFQLTSNVLGNCALLAYGLTPKPLRAPLKIPDQSDEVLDPETYPLSGKMHLDPLYWVIQRISNIAINKTGSRTKHIMNVLYHIVLKLTEAKENYTESQSKPGKHEVCRYLKPLARVLYRVNETVDSSSKDKGAIEDSKNIAKETMDKINSEIQSDAFMSKFSHFKRIHESRRNYRQKTRAQERVTAPEQAANAKRHRNLSKNVSKKRRIEKHQDNRGATSSKRRRK